MRKYNTIDELAEDLKKLIAEAADVDPATIEPETRFAEDLGIDSIGAVEIAFDIDDKFHVSLSDDDAARLTCLRSTTELMWERLQAKEALVLEPRPL